MAPIKSLCHKKIGQQNRIRHSQESQRSHPQFSHLSQSPLHAARYGQKHCPSMMLPIIMQ